MNDHNLTGLIDNPSQPAQDTFPATDKIILRELAKTVAELAARSIESEKRRLWIAHNQLEATRPVIFCDPENGWNEIVRSEDLHCQSTLARDWENRLRKEIFWASAMQDDRVTLPEFHIAHVYHETGWGMHETRIGGEQGGAYTWDAPLKDYALLDRMQFPQIIIDENATQAQLTLAHELFDGILDVQLKTVWWWTFGLTQTLVYLRGLTPFLMDFIDQPDGLHRAMAFLRDGSMARLDFLESHHLLSLNNNGTYVGSGGFGWTTALPQADFSGVVRTMDLWGFAESQETSTISPRMFNEFILPYQLPLLERFGLNCYGCCEPLDARWRYVQTIPRLRRVSISPWSNPEVMAERLGDRYIFSCKPNPAYLAASVFDEDVIRAELRRVIHAARANHCRLELIMKDNHTIANDPRRVIRWVEIAREESDRM